MPSPGGRPGSPIRRLGPSVRLLLLRGRPAPNCGTRGGGPGRSAVVSCGGLHGGVNMAAWVTARHAGVRTCPARALLRAAAALNECGYGFFVARTRVHPCAQPPLLGGAGVRRGAAAAHACSPGHRLVWPRILSRPRRSSLSGLGTGSDEHARRHFNLAAAAWAAVCQLFFCLPTAFSEEGACGCSTLHCFVIQPEAHGSITSHVGSACLPGHVRDQPGPLIAGGLHPSAGSHQWPLQHGSAPTDLCPERAPCMTWNCRRPY